MNGEKKNEESHHSLSMRCKLQICVKIVNHQTKPSVMVHHHQLNNISKNCRHSMVRNVPLFSFSCCCCGSVVNRGKTNTNPNHFYLITIWLKCLTWPFHSILWKNYHIEFDPYCTNFNCNRNSVFVVTCFLPSSPSPFPSLSIVYDHWCTLSTGHCIKKKWWKIDALTHP